MRTRRSSKNSAPGAIANSSASSMVAARMPACSTRALASSPRERPSSDRLIRLPAGAASGPPVTNAPAPRPAPRPAPAPRDHPVDRGLLDGAPPRGAADAELVAQPALGRQPIPGLQGAVLDLLGDLAIDPVVQRL